MYFRKYCYLTYTKAPEKLNSKKADNSIEKWDKDLNRQLTRENIQMAKKHMKRRSISYVIGKWNLKTLKKRDTTIPTRMAKITDNTKC